jgi:Taurine catabolism dioxygenase TauD, TfdA family
VWARFSPLPPSLHLLLLFSSSSSPSSKSHSPLTRSEAHPETKNRMPAMMHAARRVITHLDWATSLEHPNFKTAAQSDALRTVQRIAEESCMKLDTQEGDIQFINNLALLHASNDFRNTKEKSRHILRLGLRDPVNAWNLPTKHSASTIDTLRAFAPTQCRIPVVDYDASNSTTTTTRTTTAAQNHE